MVDSGSIRRSIFGYDLEIYTLPLWRGLAANTLFYAALLLMPLTMLRWHRTCRRRRRGCCVACRYDLAGIEAEPVVCPECGRQAP